MIGFRLHISGRDARELVLSPQCILPGVTVLIYPNSGDTVHHCVKVMSSRFLYYQPTYLAVNNKCLVGRYLRLCKYSVLPIIFIS